jgi:DNA-binding transcriptional LysR family regulator
MELRQLKYFIAVAEELHFGRAAESLHLSQPALSKQIQALENSLNIQLLARTKHSCYLTVAGKKFLETAHRILQELEEGIQVTRQVANGQMGRVRIGFTEATLFSLAPNIFQTYREHYPQVDLILTSGGTETNVELYALTALMWDLSIFPSVNLRFIYTLYMKKPIWLHCLHLIG